MRVVSVQTGRIAPVPGPGGALRSGIAKTPRPEGARLGPLGLEGDEIAHREFHGGPERAMLLVSTEALRAISALLHRDLPPGSFGENLTVEGPTDADVCIGDVWAVGPAEVEVSSPRGPCSTLARHLAMPDAVACVSAPPRAGWYVRVRRQGLVRPGDALRLLARPNAGWTIARAFVVKQTPSDVEGARALAALPGLGSDWRTKMLARASASSG